MLLVKDNLLKRAIKTDTIKGPDTLRKSQIVLHSAVMEESITHKNASHKR